MSLTRIYTCDVCNEVIEKGEQTCLHIMFSITFEFPEVIHFCPKCYDHKSEVKDVEFFRKLTGIIINSLKEH